ncbi:Bardet-Biedl syndrome 7 protein homolog [Fopius arisanus]|uniref:Bardet-Biedl syndrome 7 protein homolog n=1 Tax=Fopius arisanus TaxID=64838 RepID=A0A9R1SYH3_9HYME|nr:PREDICTED: Bardet-Biedl syndrome 7 protein homolog [Fopius arisanus]
MSLVLSRVDYASVGVTSKGTMRILPSHDAKALQKFAVGDHDGILHVFGMKKGELQLSFKSLPGPKIEKLVLGGTLGNPKDKIFIAYGNSVKGYTKKGKMFLEFDTSLIDPITSMFVLGPDLAACARDLYHRYQNCKDADSYLAGETLNDVILIPGEGSSVLAILACGDRAIRVLTGTKSPTILRLPSVPTVLTSWREDQRDSRNRILVGTQDGKIGLLTVQGAKTIRITWVITTAAPEVTSLDTYELEDGLDILVGRQDGTVEVFAFPEDEETTPLRRYRYNAGESVSTVMGGIIGAAGYPEILVTTYSGRIFGLTTRPPGSLEAGSSIEALEKLKTEILELEQKLEEEKEMFDLPNEGIAPLILSVNHRMILDPDTASYQLSIELDTPIDNVLIQSDTPVELLDESNSAVASHSVCNPQDNNFVLATYRCQANVNRVETRMRTIEGQSGVLQVYVTTQIQPKACRRIRIPVYALSLHARLHDDEGPQGCGGPFNELRLLGGFTVAEMHAWLALALPDIPERPQLVDGEATLNYVSTFVGTRLKCRYKKGSASFLGENVSTVIILRDLLTREATKRKIKLDVFCDVAEGSVTRVLELILPRLDAADDLTQKLRILDALQEWEMKVEAEGNLSSDYQELLRQEEALRREMAKHPEILVRLHGVITDLYVDWERAKGSRRMTSKDAGEKLSFALTGRDIEALQQIILGNDDNPPTPMASLGIVQDMII